MVLTLFTGCSFSLNDHKPSDAVATFFEKYRSKDNNVIEQLKDTISGENLTDDESKKYQELMEKQYDSLEYAIKNVEEDGDSATALVEVTVLNYHSAIMKAEEELKNNPDRFNDDEGKFSEEKYMDYKIKMMNETEDKTTHEIELNLTKTAGMWSVDELSKDDISKIHGLY